MQHDNLNWAYPVFHHFASELIRGELPMWNAATHAGEPFYPFLFQLRLLEPISLFVVLIGKRFTTDTYTLFHWHHVTLNLLNLMGIYFLFRSLAKPPVRICLIAILLLSSTFLVPLRQEGILHQFLWVPWIAILIRTILNNEQVGIGTWLMATALIGLSFQSYWVTGNISWLIFLSTFLVLRHPKKCLNRLNRNKLRLALCFSVIGLMALPNVFLFMERDQFVYPARYSSDAKMEYGETISTGAFGNVWNFLQTLDARGNRCFLTDKNQIWGEASEGLIYFGMSAWIVILIGFLYGKHAEKPLWTFMLIAISLLFFGSRGGLHQLLFFLVPPIQYLRNTHTLGLYVQTTLLFFFVIGANYLWEISTEPKKKTTH